MAQLAAIISAYHDMYGNSLKKVSKTSHVGKIERHLRLENKKIRELAFDKKISS